MAAHTPARRRLLRAAARLASLAWLVVAPVAAEEPAPGERPVAPPPTVELDALLRLPGGPAGPGGASPAQDPADQQRWEQRFRDVRGELDSARQSLGSAQRELEELASKSESWQMTAPGAQVTPDNSPISYKLRQEIRERREQVKQAERRLRDLEVEASLAGVPPEWRGTVREDGPES